MATFRVGVGSFNIQDGAVGFGTDTDGLGNLKVKGVTKTTDIKVSGASTLTRYSGFAADNIDQLENITLTSEVGTIGDIVVGVGTSVIISSGSTVTVGTVESVSIGTHFSPPVGGIEDRGQDFVEGMMRFNTDLNTMEFYNGNEWRQFNYQTDVINGGIGLKMIGKTYPNTPGVNLTKIESINLATKGNSEDFGDMITAGQGAACSSDTRAFAIGAAYNDTIEYVAFSSKGNGADFGNLTDGRAISTAGSSSTRGLLAGGWSPGNTNVIDYWEMSTVGNAIDFGDLVRAVNAQGSTNSPTRMVVVGGRTPSVYYEEIQSITIASKGNAVDIGLWAWEVIESNKGTISSGHRGFIGATGPNIAVIPTIASMNVTDGGSCTVFGDLTFARRNCGGTSSKTRGIFAGGMTDVFGDNYALNNIDFITLSTTGDAQDFGDLGTKTRGQACASNCHGGLGGY